MAILCDVQMHEHVIAANGIVWAESQLLSGSADLVRECYSFFDACLTAADSAVVADSIVGLGIAEQAVFKFNEPDAKFPMRKTIVRFLAALVGRVSRDALRELMQSGTFAIVYRHWEIVPMPRLLGALLRVASLPDPEDAAMVAAIRTEIHEDEGLDEALSAEAHGGERWSGQARLVAEILWADWEESDGP
jgi:hypothetical protein